MRTALLDWGIEVVIWFQQFSPALDTPFIIITVMGNEVFFLGLLPFVYWCLDRRLGAGLTIVFMMSAWINATAKVLFDQPRPYEYSSAVKPIIKASGGGLPSGHTQLAVVTWGYLAYHLRRPWFWVVAAGLMVLIPLSRVYLGVHFPTDLIGGYILGFTGLVVFLLVEAGGGNRFNMAGLPTRLVLVLMGPLLLILLSPGWAKGSITAAATLAGMGAGFVLEREWVGFEIDGPISKRLLRFFVGGAILLGIWAGLKVGFQGFAPEPVFRAVRYAAVGLWGALGAPWLFVRFGLADTRR